MNSAGTYCSNKDLMSFKDHGVQINVSSFVTQSEAKKDACKQQNFGKTSVESITDSIIVGHQKISESERNISFETDLLSDFKQV